MTKTQKTLTIAATICQVILGLVFVFSGFVKTVDPWGTAIKVGEYLHSFGLDWVGGYRFGFAILLCAAELILGLLLLLRVRTPLVSILSLAAMTVFTALTLYIAGWGTVEDCGCFGDAVKLTNWQTFYKNLILWPMSLLVWWRARGGELWQFSRAEVIKAAVVVVASFGLGIHCYRHLPLIDFLPYKVGVDLRAELAAESEVKAVFVCRNLESGELREFGECDTEWYDTSVWEFVESREVSAGGRNMSLGEFSVFDSEGDHTAEILDTEGVIHLLCISKLELLDGRCAERMNGFVARAVAAGEEVVATTATPLEGVQTITLGGCAVPLYNIDATTQMTMLRAKAGVVTLRDGVITQKLNCRDM